jgi:hypothetical protein
VQANDGQELSHIRRMAQLSHTPYRPA